MKSVYIIIFLLFFVLFSGCSKDFFKSYDKRIIGTWRITDVNRTGLGGSTSDLPFNNGIFTFFENGRLEYVGPANDTSKGTWDIDKKMIDTEVVHTLIITAVNYTTQQVRTQYYDEINFTGTNHFKTMINSTFHYFTTDFKR